ncbi:ATP-grasp fold amidoligase family protein [uncultured Zobellia sp.]|uniref:ATP-grasp fold amidoligase family protein n=1 Tax=uncultured Zobellia sp. TaxID=255433 RepID=UPI0025957ED6|nr:ATP-grasp fold amidoligase family protein [uncultured Zobellia sp.]
MLRKLWIGLQKKLKFLPPPIYVKAYYEYYVGKKLDLERPVEFNQKIQWLKVYYKRDLLTQLVDKYDVREYVKDKIGEQYLNELIGVYKKPSEINFDTLPQQFVIKATHGFHFNILVNDKSKFNKRKAKLLLHKWIRKNQYWRGGLEWAYKNAEPKIIVEKYLEELGKEDINDYKFFCFNGEPKFLNIDIDRGSTLKRAYYDIEWNKLPVRRAHIQQLENELPKPPNFEKMIEIARTLAFDFPFVRVDLYNLDGKIIFGEMTFYPGDGRLDFSPDEYNTIFGNYIKLPEPIL